MNVVIVKHPGDNTHFLFEVPEDRVLKERDYVIVRNKRGETTGRCVCDSFIISDSVAKALAIRYGAKLPLAKVIGTFTPERWVETVEDPAT